MNVDAIRPFPEKNIAPKTIFSPVSWVVNIDLMVHLSLKEHLVVALWGEDGSGKSSFAQALQQRLPEHLSSHLITVHPLFNQDFFLRQLGDVFSLDGDVSLPRLIASCNEKKVHTLLVIDDAHYLSSDFIDDLLCGLYQQSTPMYLHVCFISNLSLAPKLKQLATDTYPDFIHNITLDPLSDVETKTYVLQEMVSQYGSEPLITEERFNAFYAITGGRIDEINRQMDHFFSYLFHKPRWVNAVRQGGLAAGICLVLGGMSYLWMVQGESSVTIPAFNQELAVQVPVMKQPAPEVLNSQIPSYALNAFKQGVGPTSPRRVELITGRDDEEQSTTNESLAVMDKVIVAPKVMFRPKPHTVVSIKPSLKPIIATQAIKHRRLHREYTIQLLAGRNQEKLKRFAVLNHLEKTTQIRHVHHLGKDWYVLTWGEYTQHQHAKNAVLKLPRQLAKFKPWIRLVSDLHAIG